MTFSVFAIRNRATGAFLTGTAGYRSHCRWGTPPRVFLKFHDAVVCAGWKSRYDGEDRALFEIVEMELKEKRK